MKRREFLHNSAMAAVAASLPTIVRAATEPGASAFGATSTAEEVTAGMNLSGKTAVVTGCNSGLGLETMRVLAMRGAHVIGTGRTEEKARTACDSVKGNTTPVVLELSDFNSVVDCALRIREITPTIDMLICNAAVMALQELEQVYGLEKQFVVNHLGHFLLVNLLLDEVIAAPQGRVVMVSSDAHEWASEEGIQFDNLSGEKDYHPFKFYGHSKLANGLFSRELARRIADTKATSNSLHPGVIKTNLIRHMPPEELEGDWTDKDIPQGAATQCYVAAHPTMSGVSGLYFSDCNPATPNAQMLDDEAAARLWTVSEGITQAYLDKGAKSGG
jgi:NAD(P)-dependent dehydrogenase (short-subunit alcohol dehydrogenase family)